MTSEREKAELGASTLKEFFNQFNVPDDPRAAILLELSLKELMSVKVVSLLGKSQQTRNQTDNGSERPLAGDCPTE